MIDNIPIVKDFKENFLLGKGAKDYLFITAYVSRIFCKIFIFENLDFYVFLKNGLITGRWSIVVTFFNHIR